KALHVPGAGRAALGAEAAMQADILVLDHDAAGLEAAADVKILGRVDRRRVEAAAQLFLLAVGGEGDAVHRADVDAGVALDAELRREDRLNIAIEAALGLEIGQLVVEAELDLDPDVLEDDLLVLERDAVAEIVRDVVVVAPLVDAHLLAGEVDGRRRPVADILAMAEAVDRDRRLMGMRHRPDDVLRPEGGIAPEEDVGDGRLHRHGVDDGQAPFVEVEPDVALDPGEGVLLADGDQHVVAVHAHRRLAGRHQAAPPCGVVLRPHLLEEHAGEAPLLVQELLRHKIVEDRDAFMHRVLLLPGGGLHLLEAGADDDRHLLAAEPARGAAAIHRRVAAAEHDDAAADLVDMAEGDAGEPVDADMDVGGRLLAPGEVEVAAARRAGADEDRVVPLGGKRLQTVDPLAEARLDAEVEDVADLLVDHRFGEAEARDLAADHAAR